jgi:cell division protein FtsQ
MKVPAMKQTARKPRSSKKLLAFLFTFFIVLLVILFFQSSLSKITSIEVEGLELLSEDEVRQAIPVKIGDHFFAISTDAIEHTLQSVKMVQSAEASKRFPGVIRVEIHEHPRVAFQIGEDGRKEVLLADGSPVAIELKNVTIDKPILTGWNKEDPNKLLLTKVMSTIPAAYFSDISEIKPDPSESYPDKIKMYTRSHFEVQTAISYLPDKLPYLDLYITNMQENGINTGVLKLLEADNHMPFDSKPADTKPSDSKQTTDKKQQTPPAGSNTNNAKPPAKPPGN